MDKSCTNCGRYPFCKKEKRVCEDWKKQPYTYLEKIDNKTYIFRRVN